MRWLPCLYWFLCIGLIAACDRASSNFENGDVKESSAPQSEAAPPPPPGEVAPKEAKGEANVEIKLIKTGTLEFETSDLESTYQRIRTAAQTNGAFVSNESTANEYDRIVQHLTIRVPSRNFDPLLSAISKGVKHFDTKNIEAVDVTEEFVDAEARLKTKKQVEQRYQDLLKRANKISEILEIEKQIGELRAEIESIEGRLRYLSNRVDYSTLDIRFYKKVAEHRVVEENRFGRAFRNGWDGMVSFMIGLTSIWPFLIIFGIGGYFFWRRWRKK
ncbi:DUF4349 domain-containing protein [Haliscomenobacter hydrossis]|uniref:DUF4349 domain-containing protein n=1 Tax=Haliscomenobacter hydrossis (strain ATCC 27775 / DSM 1100 / LMG 10767 / O) TaxID=760192 RepID=F4KPD2_HALH1|nr:DUF4349 domain-containing protein [Haliscomenobacter hydrossis]AEE49886.1 hypothetical protein Halhy_2001 [Haliscomenobacter hydrossis DSM 1100]